MPTAEGEGRAAPGGDGADGLVEHLFRHQAGRMLATLTRIFGPPNLDLVEDVVQDALVKALEQWPYAGVPANPSAWLIQAAKNRALDVLRRRSLLVSKTEQLLEGWGREEAPVAGREPSPRVEDDVLAMMFICCHPALPREGRVALALRAVAGLSADEIARAFLVERATVAQRLVRAKRRIRDEGLAFTMPPSRELPARLDSVLEVLYLWFTAGYTAQQGAELVRADLCEEAIRLGSLVARHPATDLPKTHAALALMLLQAGRFPTRIDGEGNLLLLRDQDRSCWDRALIARGLHHLQRCAAGEEASLYHLEAGIAACHAVAPSYAATEWDEIVALYDQLYATNPSPVVALNRAVAISRQRGPRTGIEALEPWRADRTLRGYHLLPAVLAELWAEAGEPARAEPLYQEALALPCSDPERRHLVTRLAAARASLRG